MTSSRIVTYLDMNSKKLIINGFITSNFNCCPLVRHFCGKGNNDKLEQIQERSIRTRLCDTSSDYEYLLDIFGPGNFINLTFKICDLEALRSVRQENVSMICSMLMRFHMKCGGAKSSNQGCKTTTHSTIFLVFGELSNELLIWSAKGDKTP